MNEPRPDELAADGDAVPAGVEPPTNDELLEFLHREGWPRGEH